MVPELMTGGMFPKFWDFEDGAQLWKTDSMSGNPTVFAEVQVSNALELLGVPHVSYSLKHKDRYIFAVSKCFTNDDFSFVSAREIRDWCNHLGISFEIFVESNFGEALAQMCVVDYVFGNTDRHFENWGFLVSNATNHIVEFAPLFDHNQAMVCDAFGTDIDDLEYGPTGLGMLESARKFADVAGLGFDRVALSKECRARVKKLEEGNK